MTTTDGPATDFWEAIGIDRRPPGEAAPPADRPPRPDPADQAPPARRQAATDQAAPRPPEVRPPAETTVAAPKGTTDRDAPAARPPAGTGAPALAADRDAPAARPPAGTGAPAPRAGRDASAVPPPAGTGAPALAADRDASAVRPPVGSVVAAPRGTADRDASAVRPPVGTAVVAPRGTDAPARPPAGASAPPVRPPEAGAGRKAQSGRKAAQQKAKADARTRPAAPPGGPARGEAAADALGGWRLFAELWEDVQVHEVHIRGTQVSVCGAFGIRGVRGFASLDAAARTVEAITAAREQAGALVVSVGASVVVSRRYAAPSDPAAYVAAGVLSEQQLSEVERALSAARAVTVTGPAAPVIMRALASLVPAGSRVFEGPFAVLPAGCVTAASPLDADYAIGVRPGAPAEPMAAAGQIGALIANPETDLPAAVRLAVTGRSAVPEKVTTL